MMDGVYLEYIKNPTDKVIKISYRTKQDGLFNMLKIQVKNYKY